MGQHARNERLAPLQETLKECRMSRNVSRVKSERAKAALDKLLAPYVFGLTAKEIHRAIKPLKTDVSPGDIDEALRTYPCAVAKLNRYTPHGLYQMPNRASEVKVTYLVNRNVTVQGSADKANIREKGAAYYMQSHYQVQCDTFLNAFKDTCLRGHQLVLGGFYRAYLENGKAGTHPPSGGLESQPKLSIKSKQNLAYVQCLIVEWDQALGNDASLQALAENHPFIRDNAVLIMESTSGFPKGRAFFMLPQPTSNPNEIAFVIRMLLKEFDGKADPKGSRPSNGAFGRIGIDYLVLDNFLHPETMRRWAEEWNAQPKRVPAKQDIEKSDLTQLPLAYQDYLQQATPNARGWYGRVPCPHEDHEHDGWDSGDNACEMRPSGSGFVTACWKCSGDGMKPKFRFIGRDLTPQVGKSPIQAHHKPGIAQIIEEADAAEAQFVQRILDGTLDIPAPVEKPSFTQQQEWIAARVRSGEETPLKLQRARKVTLPTERLTDIIKLAASDAAIQAALRTKQRIVAVKAPTGAGKDYQHEVYIIDTNAYSLETKPHGRVADEKVARWMERTTAARVYGIRQGAEIVEALEWGLRLTNPFPEDKSWLCIQPNRVWEYMQRGGNRHKGLCLTCPVREGCNAAGYNAQTAAVQAVRAIVVANPQLFIHPLYEAQSERLYTAQEGKEERHRIALIDEADPLTMFLDCELTMQQLHDWRMMWEGEALGIFAHRVERALKQERSMAALSEYILSIDAKPEREIVSQMERVRTLCSAFRQKAVDPQTGDTLSELKVEFPNGAMASVAKDEKAYEILRERDKPVLRPREVPRNGWVTLTLDAAFGLGVFGNADTLDAAQIKTALPQVYAKHWNPLINLKRLFSRYARTADAPIHFANEVLKWEIAPILHPHIKKLICMSATLDETLFRRAFSEIGQDIEFVNVKPTPLVEGSRLFRIRTGKYCRKTLLLRDSEGQPIGLKKAGERLWKMFQTEVERARDTTHALVTYKCILEWNQAWLAEQENVIGIANFWGLEGIDSLQEADVLWILGDPELDEMDIRRCAKRLYGDEETPLLFERDDTGRYVDERAQRVWEAAVVGELLQAVGRARLNRVKGTVLILTSVDIPTVTNRDECLEFDYQDWMIDKNLNLLETRIREREEVEAQYLADLENANLTATEVASRNGMEVRHVKRNREKRCIKCAHRGRKSALTETQIARIRANAHQGLSLRKNAAAVGVSLKQVRNTLTTKEVCPKYTTPN